MQLGELAHQGHATARHDLGHARERRRNAVRRLVADDRARHQRQLAEPRDLRGVPARQEALKEEVLARKAGGDHGAGHGRGPRHHLHGKPRVKGGVHQALAGIAHARHPRVGDKRHALPRLDALERRGHPRRNHVLVASDEGNVQAKG